MIELQSFAKINLGLEIIDKRSDGYHNLRTIFQTVDFFDTIRITENKTGKINLSGTDPTIAWDEHNTISKAFRILYTNFNLHQGFDVVVDKHIPAGSGLGGGSSNAAVILLFLIDRFNLSLTPDERIAIAATIGADVPFFLIGGTALAEGIGERIIPMADMDEKSIDIVIPPISVSTRVIFSHYTLTSGSRKSKINTFINSKTIEILENNLEKTTFELFPGVGIIKDRMNIFGYELVLMSGSGSSVYGVRTPHASETAMPESKRESECSGLKEAFPDNRVIRTRTIGREHYLNRIGASPSGKALVFGAGTRRFESSRPSYPMM